VKIEDPLINIKRNGKIIYQIDCLFRLRLYNGKNHTYGISNENIVIKFDKGSYEFPIFIASGVNMGDHIDLINLEPRNTYIIEGTCNIDDTIYEFLRKMKYIRSVYFKYQIGASGKYKKVKFKNIIMAGNNKFLLKYY
jgi:hypothetical protein